MKSKIIIENTSQLSDIKALYYVMQVIDMGFISGDNQYCYVSEWEDCVVYARQTRGTTHSFKVMPNEK
jgi:hypothetical protein